MKDSRGFWYPFCWYFVTAHTSVSHFFTSGMQLQSPMSFCGNTFSSHALGHCHLFTNTRKLFFLFFFFYSWREYFGRESSRWEQTIGLNKSFLQLYGEREHLSFRRWMGFLFHSSVLKPCWYKTLILDIQWLSMKISVKRSPIRTQIAILRLL